MDIYIMRLIRVGFEASEARKTCEDFIKNYGIVSLDEYITELESDCYVD